MKLLSALMNGCFCFRSSFAYVALIAKSAVPTSSFQGREAEDLRCQGQGVRRTLEGGSVVNSEVHPAAN